MTRTLQASSSEGGAPPEDEVVLTLHDIVKRYGGVAANDGVNLTLRRGTVHAVLGENGAGKSTLMKILFGVERPDSGQVVIDGAVQDFRRPGDAIAAGVGMVFQHFGLVGELTALDNISLGAEVSSPLGVKRSVARARIAQVAQESGLAVPLTRRVDQLTIAQQQRVEILKALYRGARILILDEPTALLAPQERLGLFEAVRRLRASGVSVLFITHKLEEVELLTQDITVMRHGRVVAAHRTGSVTTDRLVSDMVGGESPVVTRSGRAPGEDVMTVTDLDVAADSSARVQGVSLSVRSGEILGLVGIDGQGHQTFCQALAGARPRTGGQIFFDGQVRTRWDRLTAMRRGVSYVPEDRLMAGVARDLSIRENLIANRLTDPRFVRGGFLRRRASRSHADEMIARFDIRCRDAEQRAGTLSGGNIQKIVLAREISTDPRLLIVCEPTRGLDIGAIASVHQRLSDAADRGAAVIVQSSDLDEVLAIADRIVIFREGRAVADLQNSEDVDIARLGTLMLGDKTEESP
ncbi:ABC transporter ATP-binding protein [Microbacterium sp. SA39]|uniref:ABC transporter ATP-binding protein n=1 Tax=Microbacterium sp. SA39 TaxID=1263625 RepID=UPI0005FA215A|nr:ABC transporter ATP-binding protein [Microbacterium sp. SA39]KJQ53886.1 Galactose/methyl galactoside import ATP-binding protein MglA [Microbacterium sp. SA39]